MAVGSEEEDGFMPTDSAFVLPYECGWGLALGEGCTVTHPGVDSCAQDALPLGFGSGAENNTAIQV